MTTESKPFDPRAHMTKVQGRDYLEVKHRIAWLNDTEPAYEVETEIVAVQEDHAIVRARARIVRDGVVVKSATSHGSESRADFPDFLEKAETKAIGRALSVLGFGTPDDDGSAKGRPVDTPNRIATNGEAPARPAPTCPMGHTLKRKRGPSGEFVQCVGKAVDGSWHNWSPEVSA